MPRKAISALPITEVRISGSTIQMVAGTERKVIMHMTPTQMYTSTRMVSSELEMISLVAASIPALPAASLKVMSSVLYSAANSFTASVARVSVSALWSSRKIITGASEQAALNMPDGARLMALFRTSWLRDRPCHFRLPSLEPMITCLATVTSDTADCTPSRLLIFHCSWSMASMVS